MNVVKASELEPDLSDPGVSALRLVTSQTGAKTMTAGVATFEPGATIIPHVHPCEETVIILEGEAIAHVEGREIPLSKYDTTIMPPRTPHFFSNRSDGPMTIAYFYPQSDPARTPVEYQQ